MSVKSPIVAGGPPAVIAHRGASRAARENTLEAFAKAKALRADAVELDVRRTADGGLVVHHDPTTPDVGVLVEHSMAEIRDRAPWIPTLDEALDACTGMWVNVEIKNLPGDPDWDPDEQVAAQVAALVGARDAHASIVVSAFNPGTLTAVREADPRIPTALLSVGMIDPLTAVAACADAGHVASHPEVGGLAGDVLEAAVAAGREAGVAVVPWTVDDPGEIGRLVRGGVAGVITNVPDVARAALP